MRLHKRRPSLTLQVSDWTLCGRLAYSGGPWAPMLFGPRVLVAGEGGQPERVTCKTCRGKGTGDSKREREG